MTTEQVETLIIGGGQAGLVTGYHLAKRGRPAVILDAHGRVGDAWRTRWDSLRLFTPAWVSGLPGMKIPADKLAFVTKDELAEYLESYASTFGLDVRTSTRVDHVTRDGGRFLITSGSRRFEADNVVVATGAHHIPKVPAFATELDSKIVQLHSNDYKGPEQLRAGEVLVVGVGNSGAEIAHELSATHKVWASGNAVPEIPFKHGPAMARYAVPVIRFMGHHVLTVRNPVGRKVGSKLVSHATPLIRVKMKDLLADGVERVGRTVGTSNGMPLLDDDRVLDVANVIWCTGFRHDYGWIDLPAFDKDGRPLHARGVSAREPGLYFIGLLFQFAATSDVLPGVGRDAEYVAKRIASRSTSTRPVRVAG